MIEGANQTSLNQAIQCLILGAGEGIRFKASILNTSGFNTWRFNASVNDLAESCLTSGSAQLASQSSKLCHIMPNGKPMIINTIQVYQQVFADITVLVREDHAELISILSNLSMENQNVNTLINLEAHQGLSQSIVAGVKLKPTELGYVIGLADMPYLTENTLSSIAAKAHPNKIVIPRRNKKNGHPVFIGAKFRSQLLTLKGDIGAKELIQENPSSVEYVDCDDSGIHHDIDTLADIRAF